MKKRNIADFWLPPVMVVVMAEAAVEEEEVAEELVRIATRVVSLAARSRIVVHLRTQTPLSRLPRKKPP